jgi:type I restriction enzyme S subunit
VTLQRGIDITKEHQRPGTVPVISSSGVSSFHDVAAVDGPGVVLGRKGVVGSVYYVQDAFWPHDTTLWVKDFHGNNPRFVYYFFKAMASRLASMDVGSANPTLNRNHIHPIPVRWPQLDEQRAIADRLGTLDDKIALNLRVSSTLEGLSDAVYLFALSEAGFDAPFLTDVDVRSGGTPKTATARYWGGDIPWISIRDLGPHAFVVSTEKTITKAGADSSAAKPLPDRSIVLSARGTVGRVALTTGTMAANQSCYGLVSATPYSVYHRTKMAIGTLRARAHGSVFDTITRETLEGLRLSVLLNPQGFERSVRPIFDLILSNTRECQALAGLRDALLPELISGNRPVRMTELFIEATV